MVIIYKQTLPKSEPGNEEVPITRPKLRDPVSHPHLPSKDQSVPPRRHVTLVNMPSYHNRALLLIRNHPFLVILVSTITVFVLRALLRLPSDGSLAHGRTRSRVPDEISMLTYNIWRSPEKMRERIVALGQIVDDLEPDILVFQEVTLENLIVLKEQRWFARYRLIPPDVTVQGTISLEIILIMYPAVQKWYISRFVNSPRKRKLVVAETKHIIPSQVQFVIAGTHFVHAGENTILRELQLQESLKVLSPYENVCVMGDLNIEDKVDGDIVLPSPWIDAWLSLPGNTDSNGLTWDRSKTPFASVLKRTVNATSYKARLDRVLCKLSDFKVKEMRVVGDKLTKSGILPSDHFGVFTVLSATAETTHHRNRETDQEVEEVYFRRPSDWKRLIREV